MVRPRMGPARLTDDGIEIDVGAGIRRQPRIEGRGRLPPRLAYLIGFKRPLDDIGDRPLFPPCQTVGETTRLGAAHDSCGSALVVTLICGECPDTAMT